MSFKIIFKKKVLEIFFHFYLLPPLSFSAIPRRPPPPTTPESIDFSTDLRSAITDAKKNPFSIKAGMAQMLRGGAIVEVSNVDQAKIAESAGACCVVVSVPSISGISRMPDPSLIKEIKGGISIPTISRARVGHFVEAQILEAVGVDYIDESEALAIADESHFINKHNFRAPFICGCADLGEALRRVREGAAMIRTQGDLTGSGDVMETVRNVRSVMGDIRILNNMDDDEVFAFSKKIAAPYDIVEGGAAGREEEGGRGRGKGWQGSRGRERVREEKRRERSKTTQREEKELAGV